MSTRLSTLLLCLGTAAFLASCRSSATAPDDPTAFTAQIEALLEAPVAPNTIGRVLVSHPGQPEPADRSIVHISSETKLFKSSATGEFALADISDVKPGQTARFNIRNVELRSYPRQVFATRIVLETAR